MLHIFVINKKAKIIRSHALKSGYNNRFVHTRIVMLYILHLLKFCFGIATMAVIIASLNEVHSFGNLHCAEVDLHRVFWFFIRDVV